MSLVHHFIPAPLSTIYTIILALSMALVFDKSGTKIFKRDEIWIRPLYFFAGLLAVSYVELINSLAGLAHSYLFIAIAICIILSALVILYREWSNFRWPLSFINETHSFQKLVGYSSLGLIVFFTITCLAPCTDADSLDYHLGLPLTILQAGNMSVDANNIHFRLFGFGEMINMLGIANGCIQLGACIQLISFCWLLAVYGNFVGSNNKIAVLSLAISLPLMLFLIPSQKHQLTGAMCSAICFYIISQKHSQLDRKTFGLLFISILFFAGIKYSFLISAAVLSGFLLYRERNVKLLLSMVVLSVIVLGPMWLFKYLHYGDPLSPILAKFAGGDTVEIKVANNLYEFRDSKLPPPLNLLFPSSFGYISTVLGLSGLIIPASFLLYKQHKAELVCTAILIVLMLVASQLTARFFIEPYFWLLPIFVIQTSDYPLLKYIKIAVQMQLLVLIPFHTYATWSLGRGIVSDSYREQIMKLNAPGYAESQWLDVLLPKSAVICSDIRSRSLLPRKYFPLEYLYLAKIGDPKFDSMIRLYRVDHIVVSDTSKRGTLKLKSELIASRVFYKATRNPVNRTQYTLYIYKLHPISPLIPPSRD